MSITLNNGDVLNITPVADNYTETITYSQDGKATTSQAADGNVEDLSITGLVNGVQTTTDLGHVDYYLTSDQGYLLLVQKLPPHVITLYANGAMSNTDPEENVYVYDYWNNQFYEGKDAPIAVATIPHFYLTDFTEQGIDHEGNVTFSDFDAIQYKHDDNPAPVIGNADGTIVYNFDYKTYTINLAPRLFGPGSDVVNFNNPGQYSAIRDGADTTHGHGGNDDVTLPNSGDATFNTDSTTHDTNYRVTGGGGNYTIVEGAGAEFITINGDGNSNITAGSGADSITIDGNGNNHVTGGSGADTIAVSGNGTNTITGTSGTYNINLSGTGNDTVSITGDGSSTIATNSGADTVTINGNGNNKVTGGSGVVSVTIQGDGNNVVDASATTSFDTLTAGGKGNNKISGGNFGNNIAGGAGNDFLTGGNGSDTFQGIGISSGDPQKGNNEINGASYSNLAANDVVAYSYDRANYTIKFLPQLTLSDGTHSVGFGAIVSRVSVGSDTIANWNALQFSDEPITELSVYHASALSFALWSLADAFDKIRSSIGSQNVSDPKLKAILGWFGYADAIVAGLAQAGTEQDFNSAIKVVLVQAATAVTQPFIDQAKSILNNRIDSLPMPDSWKQTAKTYVSDGATDLSAAVSLSTIALINRVSAFWNMRNSIDWSSQWQTWMDDLQKGITDTYNKVFDLGDPKQEWDDPQLPTPQVPRAAITGHPCSNLDYGYDEQ